MEALSAEGRFAMFGVLYALVGGGCAALRLAAKPLENRIGDAVWLILMWPIVGPLLLVRARDETADAKDTPPSAAPLDSEGIAARIDALRARLCQIERLFQEPALREDEARARLLRYEARGNARAATVAAARLAHIGKLRALEAHARDELDALCELHLQLRAQAALLHTFTTTTGGTHLLRELAARVEVLEATLADPALAPPGDLTTQA